MCVGHSLLPEFPNATVTLTGAQDIVTGMGYAPAAFAPTVFTPPYDLGPLINDTGVLGGPGVGSYAITIDVGPSNVTFKVTSGAFTNTAGALAGTGIITLFNLMGGITLLQPINTSNAGVTMFTPGTVTLLAGGSYGLAIDAEVSALSGGAVFSLANLSIL